MKWTITQLQKYRDKGLVLDETVDISDVQEIDKQIRKLSPIHVGGRADISAAKVTFHIHMTGEMVLPCSRTLVDVPVPIDVKTIETFLLKADYDYHDGEDDTTIVKGDVIDIMPIIRENLLLAIPMQVFCEDASPEGAAPTSGKDWSVVTEEEQSNRIDPRLADLAKFFDNDKNN